VNHTISSSGFVVLTASIAGFTYAVCLLEMPKAVSCAAIPGAHDLPYIAVEAR
jgi:hypothetical protein